MALKIKWITLPEKYTCKKYFSDVTSSNDWVCKAIEIAADNGIITRSNKYANPGMYITRAEALAMVMKAEGITIDTFNQDYFNTNFHWLSDVYWTDSYQFSSTWMRDVFFSYMKYVNVDVPGQWQEKVSDSGSSSFDYRIGSYATRAEVFAFARNILSTTSNSTDVSYRLEKYTFTGEGGYSEPAQKLYLIKNGTPYLVKDTKGFGIIGDNIQIVWDNLVYSWSYEGTVVNIYNIKTLREVRIYDGWLDATKKSIIACSVGGFWPGNVSIYSLEDNYSIFDLKTDILKGEEFYSVVSCNRENKNNRLNFYVSVEESAESEIFKGYYVDIQNGTITEKAAYLSILTKYYYYLTMNLPDRAYAMRSPAGVSLETFESWYKNTESVTFREDTLKSLGDNTYEFLVDMTESGVKSTYKVKSKVNLEKFTIDNISSVKQ